MPYHDGRPAGHRRAWNWRQKAAAWCFGIAAAFLLTGVIGNAVSPPPPPRPPVVHVRTVRVPGVVGMSQADAQVMLRTTGFRVGIVTPVCCGTILWVHRQSPAAGSVVPAGSEVSLQSTPGTVVRTSCGGR